MKKENYGLVSLMNIQEKFSAKYWQIKSAMEKTGSKTENQLNHNVNRLKKMTWLYQLIQKKHLTQTLIHEKNQNLRYRWNLTPHFKEHL